MDSETRKIMYEVKKMEKQLEWLKEDEDEYNSAYV